MEQLSYQELEDYTEGYIYKQAQLDRSLRRIWHTIYNAHYKKSIRNPEQLAEQWPNYLDTILGEDEINAETEDELRDYYFTLKNKINSADAAGRSTDSSIGGSPKGD